MRWLVWITTNADQFRRATSKQRVTSANWPDRRRQAYKIAVGGPTHGPRQGYTRRKMALKKFSEVAKDGCCPKCGYAVMKRGVNAVTGNFAVGLAAGLTTGGLLGPARKTIKCGGCGTKYLQG